MKIEKTVIKIIKKSILDVKQPQLIQPFIVRRVSASEGVVRSACAQVLKRAAFLRLKSLSLPPFGCRAGFPPVGSAKIMAQELLRFLRWNKSELKQVSICVENAEMLRIFKPAVEGYIQHIQNDMGKGPYVTVDAIIELKEGVILIERSNPPYGWALPGGFVDYGESLEEAVIREAKEETHMTITTVKQLHTYSDPQRDPRFHTIGTVFICRGKGRPRFGDDAKGLKIVPYQDLLKLDYAFDHKQILRDYLKSRRS